MAEAIDYIQKVVLNNHPQKIHIRFTNPDAPILLVLHGGPGVANRHAIMARHADLAEDFVLVTWDQRGCAGSYQGVDPTTLTVPQMVEDARALIEWLCTQFGAQKVYVLGLSWGSELGILLVQRYPELVEAFVGSGQCVDGIDNERLSWKYAVDKATEARDLTSMDLLSHVGPPIKGQYQQGLRGLMAQRSTLAKFEGESPVQMSFMDAYVRPIVLSGEYTASDIWGYIKGYSLVLKTMWPTATLYNFREEANRLTVPVYFFQGRHDMTTPSPLVEEYFALLEAPHKELIWFEHSAHGPLNQEPEKFKRLLKEKLLP